MNDKLQVTLSDGQIEQIKKLTLYHRNRLGFLCKFKTHRVQIYSGYSNAIMITTNDDLYTFDEFVKRVECIDQRGNSVDVASLGLFNN